MAIPMRDTDFVLRRFPLSATASIERYLVLMGYGAEDIYAFLSLFSPPLSYPLSYHPVRNTHSFLPCAVLREMEDIAVWEWREDFPSWKSTGSVWEMGIICVTLRRLVFDGYSYRAIERATGKSDRMARFHVGGRCHCDNRKVFHPLRRLAR